MNPVQEHRNTLCSVRWRMRWVFSPALDIPHIKSREVLNQLLLALEDEYGLTVTITENNERSICNGK